MEITKKTTAEEIEKFSRKGWKAARDNSVELLNKCNNHKEFEKEIMETASLVVKRNHQIVSKIFKAV